MLVRQQNVHVSTGASLFHRRLVVFSRCLRNTCECVVVSAYCLLLSITFRSASTTFCHSLFRSGLRNYRSTKYRVTTFPEFQATWKCQGILQRSGKRHKVRERSRNLCSQGYLIVTPWQYAGNKDMQSQLTTDV